jgi:hypothetical protein
MMRFAVGRLIVGTSILVAAAALPGSAIAQDVRVTVLTIMANDRNEVVDPKLKDVAREIRKQEPSLTGYRLGNTTCKKINVGQKEAIQLFGDEDKKGYSADVKLLAKDDTNKKVVIEFKPPTVGAITIGITYEKYFPIITRAVVDGERLIIAIMVKPVK